MTQAANHATQDSARDELMSRVRAALNRGTPATLDEPAPVVDESIARLAGPDDDLLDLFHDRAVAVGMHVHRIDADQLSETLFDLLEQQEVRSVVLGSVPLMADLENGLASRGIKIVAWKSSGNLDIQFDVDCGITGVHGALAETGTLVVYSDAQNSRGLSLVPPLHVAIVRKNDILPDMLDLWARLKGIPNTELPSNIVFITGPSKTADIEGELVTGVHGPEAVHVLLVED